MSLLTDKLAGLLTDTSISSRVRAWIKEATPRIEATDANVAALTTRVAALEAAKVQPAPSPVPVPAPMTLLHADPMTGDQSVEWGLLQAVSADRIVLLPGGDPRPRGDGSPPPTNLRRLWLYDGDYFYGERCELGANERRFGTAGGAGTFMLYQSGQRYHTYFSLRLGADFPISTTAWQCVMQMKQCQPYTNDGYSSPIISLEARLGQWQLITANGGEASPLWTAPAVVGRWVRFHFDITYSPSVTMGRVRLQIDDRAGAVDFVPQHDSGTLSTPTLTKAVGAQSGTGWSLADGEPIPSHLRLGPYRNAAIVGSTSVDVSNVQVYQ